MVEYYSIYEPLLPGHLPPEVRYVVVLGGRGSAKSFHTSTGILAHSGTDANTILYTRYTMTAANVSIIPEFAEKIDLVGGAYDIKRDEIRNQASGGKVLFRGIMQGSKNQTARLKSIPNIKLFALDEGEEMVDETSFDVIDLSLRKEGVQALLWTILNPSDVTHWIYRRFFAKVINRLKPDTCTIIGDTCYIWTTYLINRGHLDRAFLDLADRMAAQDPDKYRNLFLGYWRTRKEGLIFPRWVRVAPEEIPIGLPMWYGVDWGYGGDESAVTALCYEPTTGTLYLREVFYKRALPPEIAKAVIEDGKAHGLAPGDCLCYCDPARPDNRDMLRLMYGINAISADNRDKAGRIGYLQGFRVRFAGDNIAAEVKAYSWQPNPLDKSTFTDKPQDGFDHAVDSTLYGSQHLRRLGVVQL